MRQVEEVLCVWKMACVDWRGERERVGEAAVSDDDGNVCSERHRGRVDDDDCDDCVYEKCWKSEGSGGGERGDVCVCPCG